ncbi:MAG TPA: hypothetical protein VFX25_35190, partial [Streptosporangiaceae bacterium]|nr:hypothetical protein [Streptosporangiaceae bacterium]
MTGVVYREPGVLAGPGSASARPGTRRSRAAWASRSRPWPSGSSGWRRRSGSARYAQACNLFPGPDLARKLDVLRAHCEAEGRDYDEIEKSCYFRYDVGAKGEHAGQGVDQLGRLAELGFGTAIGQVVNVWDVTPL